ncbi:hypothetical protein [Tropicimonas sp. IMCC34011]|uniref:hypothetical protein n=1 Tax=Tropicimonas sp. IMCC34011 TaxID=2248759 RepID=UPI0013007992|nr:hypothetical protein [Tropicimonas sp. IMCC34011]
MNSELRRVRDRTEAAWQEAVNAFGKNVISFHERPVAVRLWSRTIEEAYRSQWLTATRSDDAGWEWPEISNRYRNEPKARQFAIMADDRLAALCFLLASRQRVLVRFLEGDPRQDCPLRGKRALLALDLAATYGQRLGCHEIHLEPVNEPLAELYRGRFGFKDGKDGNKKPVLKRGLA